MSYYDDKPKKKNDDYDTLFEKSYPDYSKRNNYYPDKNDPTYMYLRERGGCLTAFLVVQFLVSGLIIMGACWLMSQPQTYSYGYSQSTFYGIGTMAFFLVLVRIAVLVGVWNWNRASFYILVVLYLFSIVSSIVDGSIFMAILTGIEVSVFAYLVQQKMDFFE